MARRLSTTAVRLCLGFAVLSCVISQAQVTELAKHPGDIIKFQIKFDGPNADKVKYVNANMSTRQTVPTDQAGFTNGFGTKQGVLPSAPRTFVVELTVPPDAATGEYRLSVSAGADEGSANYSDGQEFHIPAVHIENPKKFTPPAITVNPLP